MGRFYIFPIFIATFASRRVTLIATHSKSQKQTRLPIHYLYFILPFKPLINKEVIKVFQNYIKILIKPHNSKAYESSTVPYLPLDSSSKSSRGLDVKKNVRETRRCHVR